MWSIRAWLSMGLVAIEPLESAVNLGIHGRAVAGAPARHGREEVVSLEGGELQIGDRSDGRGSRHVAEQRDLTHVVAVTQARDRSAAG